MTAPRTKFPIEAFGPELMAALTAGGRRKVIIKFDEPEGFGIRKARNFQRRIHTLRQRMRQENHPDYKVAARARCSLFWGTRAVVEQGAPEAWRDDQKGLLGAWIVLYPHDSEFSSVLERSGIKVDGVVDQEEAPAHSMPEPEVLNVEDLLRELEIKEVEK